jgi:hypothetical protein
MRTKFIAAVLVALSASTAVPAFASGYGPAPFYKPSTGAPASQRGPGAQPLAADYGDAQQGYGGVAAGRSQSGGRAAVIPRDTLHAHH